MIDLSKIIVVDIGNSAIKLGLAETERKPSGLASWSEPPTAGRAGNGKPGGPIQIESKLQWLHEKFDAAELDRWAPRGESHWFIASVQRSKTESLLKWLAQHRPEQPFVELAFTDLPLKIEVDAPQRVGIDRLLSVVGANARRQPDRPAITITAGTAVTVNAIDADGKFLGGAILPGKPLLAKALHQYTDALPHVTEFDEEIEPIGKNTSDAIRSGVHFGLLGAVKQVVEQFEKVFQREAEIFIAGGDASSIYETLRIGTFVPDLVLEGAAIVAFSLLGDE